MAYTYAEYFDILDYELQQKSEGGDLADDDAYRFLPSDHAERVINTTIKEFVLTNADRFEQELTVTFKDSPSGAITEAASGSTYTTPDQIAKIISAKVDNNWFIIGDSSDLSSTIYSTSNKIITNADGWVEDDTITFKVVLFPTETMTDDGDITARTGDNIPFPDEYTRLLTLAVKKKAYARKGKGLSQFEYSEYMDLNKKWVHEKGKVRKVARVAFRGYGFGR